ncbi:MAG: hypothetical protein L0Y32_05830 [Nevskiales bacterium]|nr:hypothetical protein [Nevskiales bacterium]
MKSHRESDGRKAGIADSHFQNRLETAGEVFRTAVHLGTTWCLIQGAQMVFLTGGAFMTATRAAWMRFPITGKSLDTRHFSARASNRAKP